MPRTKQRLTMSELRVGIFMLAALFVFAFLILNSSGDFNPFEKKLRLKVRFASADGLRKNAEVQLAGVSIGKVEEVTFFRPTARTRNESRPNWQLCRRLITNRYQT